MTYELAKELKEAGLKGTSPCDNCRARGPGNACSNCGVPTLEELIAACGENTTIRLQSYYDGNDLMWQADTAGNFRDWLPSDTSEVGTTPLEAVANLYLALHPKKV